MEIITNFRDLGGKRTADGRKIKKKRLLRCSQIVGISENDRKVLEEEYGLRMIADLRSAAEKAAMPDDVVNGAAYVSVRLHAADESGGHMPGSREVIAGSKEEMSDYMLELYRHLMTNADARTGYKYFLDILRDHKEGAAAFHCYAGKDRTGLAAVMIHTILGTPKETIFEEYMLSNAFREIPNKKLFASMREEGMTEREIDVMRVACCVNEEYLAEAFHIAEQKSGSMLGYLRQEMGVTDGDIARFQANYLE